MSEFRVSTVLSATPDELWTHSTSPAGVNREFLPLCRMTFPPGLDDLVAGWRPGELRFRSWILLLGLIPIEYDDVVFVEVEPGRRLLNDFFWENYRKGVYVVGYWKHWLQLKGLMSTPLVRPPLINITEDQKAWLAKRVAELPW